MPDRPKIVHGREMATVVLPLLLLLLLLLLLTVTSC
jgi:hypothetical protein